MTLSRRNFIKSLGALTTSQAVITGATLAVADRSARKSVHTAFSKTGKFMQSVTDRFESRIEDPAFCKSLTHKYPGRGKITRQKFMGGLLEVTKVKNPGGGTCFASNWRGQMQITQFSPPQSALKWPEYLKDVINALR